MPRHGARIRRAIGLALVATVFALGSGACDFVKQKLEEIDAACKPEGASKCSKDAPMMRVCKNRKLVDGSPCRGPKGCSSDGSQVQCDESIARAGDLCGNEGSACSEDGKETLYCLDHRFQKELDCTGEKGCSLGNGKRNCDRGRGTLRDACGEDGHGAAVCSADGHAMLTCKSHAWTLLRECHGPGGCREGDGGVLRCDQ